MKRKTLMIQLVFLMVTIAALLLSCSSTASRGDRRGYAYSVYAGDAQAAEDIHVIPWREEAAQEARESGTLRFYFMSGEGQSMASDGNTKFGDSCLIVFPNGQVMLIDGGMPAYGATLTKNLQHLGISKIDYLVLSHMHDDHYGGLFTKKGVLANFEIGTMYWNGVDNLKPTVVELFTATIAEYAVKTEILVRGDELSIGDVQVKVLNPPESSVGDAQGTVGLNNSSLALKIVFKEFSALLSGDLYIEREFDLIDLYGDELDVDLVKANHHGRNTSNSKDWAQATTPRIVVTTAGNPPDEIVYAYYARVGARVLSDYLDGYIKITTDGERCDTMTSRERVSQYFSKYDAVAQTIYQANY